VESGKIVVSKLSNQVNAVHGRKKQQAVFDVQAGRWPLQAWVELVR
jgi:hypothetical protein